MRFSLYVMSFELGRFPLDEIVTGQIIKLEPRGVLVDFGAEKPAYIPQLELSLAKIQSPEEALRLNQIRDFLVIGDYDGQHNCFFPGYTLETLNSSERLCEVAQYRASLGRKHLVSPEDLLIQTKVLDVQPDGIFVKIQWFLCSEHPPRITFSIRRLEMQIAWRRIRQLQVENITLYPKIIRNKYVAIAEVEMLRGFINNLDRSRETLVVGKVLPLKILEANEALNRLQLIQPSILIKLKQLQVGQGVEGRVKVVKPFGVFVEIGGLFAFQHRSKIIPVVEHPNQVFKVNDFVKAVISEVNLEKARVHLENCEKLV